MLKNLRDVGNIVVVVEYDEDIIKEVDYIVDIGLGVGEYGGEVVVVGDIDYIKFCEKLIIG